MKKLTFFSITIAVGIVFAVQQSAMAATTVYDGLANGADADPLVETHGTGTVTETAGGYDVTVGVSDTAYAAATAITGVAPQDWVATAVLGTDLQVAADGGYIAAGMFAGGDVEAFVFNGNTIFAEITVGDPYNIVAGGTEGTISTEDGTFSFRISRTEDTLTYEYKAPGSDVFVVHETQVLSGGDELAAADIGFFIYPFAGAEFGDGATVVLESLTFEIPGEGPNLSLGVEGATFAEAGGSITLSANDDMMAPFQWKMDGADMGSETGATLSLDPTETGDSGVYTLDFNDGEAKATLTSNPVSIAIFTAGSLPVAGLMGLGLLAIAGALGGVVALRRK